MQPDDVRKVVGTKQVVRAIESEQARRVYLAQDADDFVRVRIEGLCQAQNVAIQYVPSMEQLGRDCGIRVGAATAAEIIEA